ncbi:MAG: RNA polymerase sigma factor, partial [Solirubrobacteraceae bacterium]
MWGVVRYRGVKPLRRRRAALSDAELLQRARFDPSAFAELYTRHVGDVHAWLSRRLAWAASDLTAETFARALLSIDRFHDDHDGFALPWLLGIARNVLADTLRRDQIETRARERLGLPLDLAAED